MNLINDNIKTDIGISVDDLSPEAFLDLYETNNTGLEKNIKQAIKWFKLATEIGYARTMYYIGSCYEAGTGVEQDYEIALQWYKFSMEYDYPRAFAKVAIFYEEGLAVEKDLYYALRLYKKAADLGDEYAQKRLGWYDYQGISAPLSLELIMSDN